MAHPIEDGADRQVAALHVRLVQHPVLAAAVAGDPHEPLRERAVRTGWLAFGARQSRLCQWCVPIGAPPGPDPTRAPI
jgi:hypothetical protein